MLLFKKNNIRLIFIEIGKYYNSSRSAAFAPAALLEPLLPPCDVVLFVDAIIVYHISSHYNTAHIERILALDQACYALP